jgi:uncharacterized protein (DUF433 family)
MTNRVATLYRHVEMDEQNRPIIAGTRFKVRVLIALSQRNGWNADELHKQFPDLSMAQIHSAFAYYWDHKDEIDQAIEELAHFEEEYRQVHAEPSLLKRVRDLIANCELRIAG